MNIAGFLLLTSLIASGAWAQDLLTETRKNITLTVKPDSDMSIEDYKNRSQAILDFIEKKLYPKVPAAMLTKLNERRLKIEVTSKIKKGGLFIPEKSSDQELLLQIRENLFADESVFRILAHEWFHALHYVVKPNEPSWVREGLAQVFENITLGGYNGPNLLQALENSTTPLEHNFDVQETNREAYGHVFCFFYYLHKKKGDDSLFWNIVQNGISEIKDFNDVVIDSELARFHNRKVKTKGQESDRYWLTPEFTRTPHIVRDGVLDQVVIDQLPAYQPLLLAKTYKKSIEKLAKNAKLKVYTLSSTYPYEVTPGLTPVASQNEEILLLLKIK